MQSARSRCGAQNVVDLATHARSLDLDSIDFSFVASGKNQPAQEFLESEFFDYRSSADSSIQYRIPVELASVLRYSPTPKRNGIPTVAPGDVELSENGESVQTRAKTLAWIAAELLTGDAIYAVIQDSTRKKNGYGEFIAPRTSSERIMAEVWADALGVTNIGIRDNFFQVGGDSLAMVRVILRLNDLTDFESPIRAFFEAPTIEEQLLRFPIRLRSDD